MTGGLRVDAVTDAAGLEALEPEWAALFAEIPAATPFQAPAWAIPWWQAFAPGEPFVVTVRRGGRLVGLAPLYVERGRDGPRLLPIGVAVSDLLDVLLHPRDEDQAGPALAAFVRDAGLGPWCMEEVPPDAAALRLPSRPGDRDEIALASPCSGLRWSGGDPWAAIPTKQRANVRRARNRAARRGLRVVEAGAGTAGELLEVLFELHGARWESRGAPGVLADPRVRAFHRRAVPRLVRAGLLRLRAVWIDGRPAAVIHGFHHRDRGYAYLMGFDPGFAFESPGTIALAEAIAAAGREGARRFELLRGREPYKAAWGAVERWNLRRVLAPGPPRPAHPGVRHALALVRACTAAGSHDPLGRALAEAPPEVRALAARHPEACDLVRTVLAEVDHGSGGGGGVARWAAAFDRAARVSPEAGVAVYSLGDPALLRAATDEVVGRLRDWGLLGSDRDVLDLGCGIGRVTAAVAAEVRSVVGVDVSAEMLVIAAERCAGLPGVRLVRGTGADLAGLADAGFDLVLAVDVFPYLVLAGDAAAAAHVAEAARVLRPGGSLVALNWSYRGDPAADRDEVHRLARAHGLTVARAGDRAFDGWDGRAFHMIRPG